MAMPCVRVLCLPDVERPIGGVKQLYRHVEHLTALGWNAAIVTESQGFRPSWFSSSAETISLEDSFRRDELMPHKCVLVLPETYLNVDLRSFHGFDLSSLARVVFNQNAYYSYADFSPYLDQRLLQFYDSPSVLQVLSVSEDTHQFLSSANNVPDNRLSRIVNAIEPIFSSDYATSKRFHWMPRKNPEHVQAILQSIHRSEISYGTGWEGSPLQGLTHNQVAKQLNGARIFLSFGHPEGFGLPIAEAMAAGCWVVGYSGGGGRELFGFGGSDLVHFGDWSGFLESFRYTLKRFALYPRDTSLRLHRQALAIQNLFSVDQERASIELAWTRIYKAFQYWSKSL